MIDISKINIPQNPGIYLMKDADDKIIYIGKAKNLKNRVRSYFNKNQNYKTQKVEREDGSFVYSCTCPGSWRAKDKRCKHIKELEKRN